MDTNRIPKQALLFKVCKSVHHRTIQINHQPDATIFQFIILTFIYSSTCFGRSPAHHQELTATAVVELLMMGGRTPKTCWAVNKRQDNKLKNCCTWLVIYLNWKSAVFHAFRRTRRLSGFGRESLDNALSSTGSSDVEDADVPDSSEDLQRVTDIEASCTDISVKLFTFSK